MNRRDLLKLAAGLAAIATMPAFEPSSKDPVRQKAPSPKLIKPKVWLQGEINQRTFDRPGCEFHVAPMTRVSNCILRGRGVFFHEGPACFMDNLFEVA